MRERANHWETRATRARADVLAADLGHVLSPWEKDDTSSFVAECRTCEYLIAVDVNEVLGWASTKPCPGPAIW